MTDTDRLLLLRRLIARLRAIAPERLVLLGLAFMAVVLWLVVYAVWPRPLMVTAFAVGNGDCLLIRTPHGRTVLIDGGSRGNPEIGERIVVPNLCVLGVRRLDVVIVTHPDSDHVNALPAVLDALPVGMIIHPGIPDDDGPLQQVLGIAEASKIPCKEARRGARLRIEDTVVLDILHPPATLLRGTVSDDNTNSLVAMLTYGKSRMLFTGDVTAEGELVMLTAGDDLRAEVLKVAHHGSRFSTTDAWLERVRPTIAVISAKGATGPAKMSDHPHAELLQRLHQRDIDTLRTDEHGMITLRSDGHRWHSQTYQVR